MIKNNILFFNNSSTAPYSDVESMNFNRSILILAAFSLLAGGAFVFGRYCCQPKKSRQDNMTRLLDAIARCKEETDKQNSEVVLINDALKEFNREGRFLINQYRQRRGVVGDRLFQVANEQTALLETRETVAQDHLLDELVYLTANYPESGYEANPCIETVESYLEARKEHHEKIVSIANVLLPDFMALIVAARKAQDVPLFKNTM